MGVVRMQWWGALSCLLVSQGLALGPGGPSQCQTRCMQVYSVHTNEFEQINPALEACQRGCEFFSRIEFRNGVQEPLNTLRNCNYSCDERFEGPGLPACQSGCGFHFDNDVTQSPPSQSPPQGPNMMRTQTFTRPEPSRPTIISSGRSDQPLPIIMRQEPSRPTMMRSEPPRPIMSMRAQNPFMNLLRSQGPITIRQNTPIVPQMMTEMTPRPMNMSPSQASQEGPIVTKQNPNGPTIIGFSLPQLLSRVNSMIPRMEQGAVPRVMEISMRNPFRDFQRPSMSLPEMPRMVEGFFGRKDDDIEPFMEETLFGDDDDSDDFIQESLFGRKDDDIEPFGGFEGLFEQINNHMGRLMSAMPQQVSPNAFQVPPNAFQRPPNSFQRPPSAFQRPPSAFQAPPNSFQRPPSAFQRTPSAFQRHQIAFQMGGLRGMMPFGQPTELGKLTIIKAGPGFHEEKHFDIGPNGKLTEVNAMPMHDALEHANPMDTHFNSNDVEVFHDEDEDIVKTNDAEVTEVESEKVEKEPVMDVRG